MRLNVVFCLVSVSCFISCVDVESSRRNSEVEDTSSSGTGSGGDRPQSPSEAEGEEGLEPTGACRTDLSLDSPLPRYLSETGLYRDILSKEVSALFHSFRPEFELWSDGARKERWWCVPEGAVINSSDMNDWAFPVGATFFKEFVVGEQRVETRIIRRVGSGPNDFQYASYVWNDGESEAEIVPPEGLLNAGGTDHDIPSRGLCLRCHGTHATGGGRPSRALGFSALQLSHGESGVDLRELLARGLLSSLPEREISFPGDGGARRALGYLHANCGTCHNSTKDRVPHTDVNFWVGVEEERVEETAVYSSTVGQRNRTFNDQHVTARIEAGAPETSAVLYRMKQRGNNAQMPPLGTEVVDEDGVSIVRTWIEELP